ncbi:shikimate kinase [Rouxiella badensis]|uniref:Adenylate kinase n=1 Tax=Rouxiella badensis TaxID=1646377 RepID=A0A1X0WG36_9GAMM|nr:shikimate kinase [Rouxiella badensis]MCC3704774.1 AAA family ATPase [Rouxiella badensis]MCC3720970.1 AAA family ATPase [Rouxiella badensis]MCC3729581.1 AAA family ATPase [Rouxiella badensis]MCC3735392.1 AAA family ATPase [Rouxiella badensis]MCC3741249.1 AAA family ATPase [Rouxiella badensis]
MKINVIGTSGSGKSTFAKALAQQLAIPYIEMDTLFWKPHWTGSSDAELFEKLEQAISQPSWVLDGNYKRSQPIKWRDVDIIIWVDYSFGRTLYQAVKRALQRASHGQELWAGTGNRETFRQSFFSRESIILWTLKTFYKNRRQYQKMMISPPNSQVQFVRLRSHKQARAFIDSLGLQNAAAKKT